MSGRAVSDNYVARRSLVTCIGQNYPSCENYEMVFSDIWSRLSGREGRSVSGRPLKHRGSNRRELSAGSLSESSRFWELAAVFCWVQKLKLVLW